MKSHLACPVATSLGVVQPQMGSRKWGRLNVTSFFRYLPSPNWSLVLVVAAVQCLSTTGIAWAEGTWGDEIANSLTFTSRAIPIPIEILTKRSWL